VGPGKNILANEVCSLCLRKQEKEKKRTIMVFLPAQARADPVSSIDRSKAKLLGGGHLAKTTIVSCKDQGRKE